MFPAAMHVDPLRVVDFLPDSKYYAEGLRVTLRESIYGKLTSGSVV